MSIGKGKEKIYWMKPFWLMTFLGSASFIGNQVLANGLIDNEQKNRMMSTAAIWLALLGIIYVTRVWKNSSRTEVFEDHIRSYTYIFEGKSCITVALYNALLIKLDPTGSRLVIMNAEVTRDEE